MENVILIIHLILALSLIGIVLLQRSEGGGLGMGGGGGAMSSRAAATALGKLTWLLAISFIITSITLTILAAANSDNTSVVDRITESPKPVETPVPDTSGSSDLLPPAPVGDTPLVPQAAD